MRFGHRLLEPRWQNKRRNKKGRDGKNTEEEEEEEKEFPTPAKRTNPGHICSSPFLTTESNAYQRCALTGRQTTTCRWWKS
eukprot:2620695-Pyramimonas_sp.AAC.1